MKRATLLALCLIGTTGLGLRAGDDLANAVKAMDLNAVKARLAAGDPVNERARTNGWTPLHYAVFYEQFFIAKLLLEQGADPDLQVTDGFRRIKAGATPLIIAGYYGMNNMVELLLRHKARLDFADQSGATALDYARKYNFLKTAELLEKAAQPRPAAPAAADGAAGAASL
jgi:ankyrin repeat protein